MSDAKPVDAAPKKNVLLIALVAVNMVGMLAIGAYIALRPAGGPEAGGEGAHGAAAHEEPEEAGPMLELESLIVNLQEGPGGQYLKITTQLEIASEEEAEHVTARLVPIKDGMITYLSALTAEQVTGPEHMEQVREHILGLAHAAAGEERVRRVYFTEYLVQ